MKRVLLCFLTALFPNLPQSNAKPLAAHVRGTMGGAAGLSVPVPPGKTPLLLRAPAGGSAPTPYWRRRIPFLAPK